MTTVQEKKDVVVPNLVDTLPATHGHYNLQIVWELDPATLLPVGNMLSVTLPE